MNLYSGQITHLIEELSKLPGIGAKSAGRLAFHIMNMPVDQVESLSRAIIDARINVKYCQCCCNLSDQEICPICSDESRDKKTIMVVETPGIWQLMKRHKSIMGFIMFFMAPSRLCLASGRQISV